MLSYAIQDASDGSVLHRLKPHLAYHGAKIVSYTAVGLLLGSLGSFVSGDGRSWVSVVAGAYMVLLGLAMTGRFPVLVHLTPRPPRFFVAMLSKLRRRGKSEAEDRESSIATPIGFGLITGLMPCGPLIAAQVAAAGSGSPTAGGLLMLGFGLGTAPLMLGYGAVASYLGARFKRYMSVAAAIMIIVLGLVMVDRGATALGLPLNFNIVKRAVVGMDAVQVDESQYQRGQDGIVEVPLGLQGFTFSPSVLVIPEDTPVRIIVNRKDDNICSDELWIPSLGVKAPLTPNGITTIDLPATQAGTYQMTCQMGMLSATLQVGELDDRRSVALWLGIAAAVTGAGATGVLVRHRRRQFAAANYRTTNRRTEMGSRKKKNGGRQHNGSTAPAAKPVPASPTKNSGKQKVLVITGVALAVFAVALIIAAGSGAPKEPAALTAAPDEAKYIGRYLPAGYVEPVVPGGGPVTADIPMAAIQVEQTDDGLTVPLSEVTSKRNVGFTYTKDDGTEVALIAYVKPSGKLLVAVSYCVPCKATSHTMSADGTMTCGSCGTKRDIETSIGISGACKLYPMDELPVVVDGDTIAIEKSVLENWTEQPLDRQVG